MYFIDHGFKGEIGGNKTDNPELGRILGYEVVSTEEVMVAAASEPTPYLTVEQTQVLGELSLRQTS